MTTLIPKIDLKDGGATPTGAVNRTINSKAQDILSVKDFGAVCDGTTDDTAAVQAAINYCASFAQWPILSIPGQCLLSSSITIDRPVDTTTSEFIIQGIGGNAGFKTAIAQTMFSSTIATTNVPVSEHIVFQNITFTASTSSVDCYVLNGDKFLRMKFNQCFFKNIRLCVSATYIQSFHFINCQITSCPSIFINVLTGGLVTGLVSDLHWTDCAFEQGANSSSSFLQTVGVVTGCSFKGGVAENCGGFYTANQTWGVSFNGMYFEGITSYAILLGSASAGIRGSVAINGCFFNGVGSTVGNYAISCGQMANVFGGGNYTDGNLYLTTSMANGGDGLVSSADFAVGNIYDWGKNDSFAITSSLSGFTTTVSPVVNMVKEGRVITLKIPTGVEATSNATTMKMTGIPAAILPKSGAVDIQVYVVDNGNPVWGMAAVDSTGITFSTHYKANTGFTASGTKGLAPQMLVWQLPETDY